jgi:hypothetical protein
MVFFDNHDLLDTRIHLSALVLRKKMIRMTMGVPGSRKITCLIENL